MYLFQPFDDMGPVCPHEDLDWQDQYLWQKVAYAKSAGVTEHHDDDDRVIAQFKLFAPKIRMALSTSTSNTGILTGMNPYEISGLNLTVTI
jgi:hypothetical protein